jgi:hypothetical protein
MTMENQTDTTSSAQEAVQKPPTSVFILQVGRTRYYNIYVEAESAAQAQKAWEAEGGGEEGAAEFQFEYGARCQPDYEWEDSEDLISVRESNRAVEDAVVSYNEVRSALGLEEIEED